MWGGCNLADTLASLFFLLLSIPILVAGFVLLLEDHSHRENTTRPTRKPDGVTPNLYRKHEAYNHYDNGEYR